LIHWGRTKKIRASKTEDNDSVLSKGPVRVDGKKRRKKNPQVFLGKGPKNAEGYVRTKLKVGGPSLNEAPQN